MPSVEDLLMNEIGYLKRGARLAGEMQHFDLKQSFEYAQARFERFLAIYRKGFSDRDRSILAAVERRLDLQELKRRLNEQHAREDHESRPSSSERFAAAVRQGREGMVQHVLDEISDFKPGKTVGHSVVDKPCSPDYEGMADYFEGLASGEQVEVACYEEHQKVFSGLAPHVKDDGRPVSGTVQVFEDKEGARLKKLCEDESGLD